LRSCRRREYGPAAVMSIAYADIVSPLASMRHIAAAIRPHVVSSASKWSTPSDTSKNARQRTNVPIWSADNGLTAAHYLGRKPSARGCKSFPVHGFGG
jgi:hypothetical protein